MAPKPRTTTSYAIGMCNSSNAGEMPGAPFTNRIDDRHKAAAHRRQAIVDLGRHRAVVAAVDQAGRGQCLELAAQHPGPDLRPAAPPAQHAPPTLPSTPHAILSLPPHTHLPGTTGDRHRQVASFLASLDGDPALKGKIGYRCMKGRDGADYYHIATVFDDTARIALQERAFFKHYTEATRVVSGDSVEVVPLEMIAETAVA